MFNEPYMYLVIWTKRNGRDLYRSEVFWYQDQASSTFQQWAREAGLAEVISCMLVTGVVHMMARGEDAIFARGIKSPS